ncbi:hypothetical protein Thein_1964 [Thermodesulfatator indicus DSM 15286]|uniref:DUF8196 domain-containing protein n=1 Tax=Thermodesulfatator indicus (strain DSM 15286 / JCM 11887 / CIR29812) TaxID=667014 RepID=F8ACP0_THEID|nr:hypothetical protein [Thermodesulfatator indicus]AEH45818.1 hypothetical protein Thein_1964 [Thermodesulfatator indicus DSM 15286]
MREIAMEIQEIKQELKNQEEKVDRTIKELELLRQISTDNLMAVLELRKYHEGLSREFKDFKDEMKAFKDEINKKWGDLANRLGTLTEDIFAPGIPYLVKNLGYKVKERMLNVEYKKDGMYNQYDVIVIAEDKDGKDVAFVAEVKSQLRAEHFDDFKTKLKNLIIYKPEYENKKIIPVLAAFNIPEDLVNLANKREVLLVRMGGEYLEPLNPDVVK